MTKERASANDEVLSTDLNHTVNAALAAMRHDGGEYPQGFEEALYLSHALEVMIDDGIDDVGSNHDAAVYIANRVTCCLLNLARQLDRVSDILVDGKRAGLR